MYAVASTKAAAADRRAPAPRRRRSARRSPTIDPAQHRVDDRAVAVRMLRRGRAPLRLPGTWPFPLVIAALRPPTSTAATSEPSRIAVATASMSAASDRSSRAAARASARTRAPRARPAPGSSGARNSTAWAPASSSIASARSAFASTCQRLQPGGVPHRDVILLARARRDRVDARRMAEHLVLADERRGHVLRDHEARS